jgi:hypothetical protein
MNILDLKRKAVGYVLRWNDRGTDSSGTGSGNTGSSMSGGNSSGGGSAIGGSSSGGGSFNAAKDSQAANESLGLGTNPDAFGGTVSFGGTNYGSSSSAPSTAAESRASQTPAQQAAMDVAMGLLARDSMTGKESVQAANEATDFGKTETTATKAMVNAIAKGEDIGKVEGLNPNNPTQNVANLEASQNVGRAIGYAAPSLASLANPGFGLAMSAAKAYQANTLPGFAGNVVGGMIGSRLGIPGLSGVLGSVGSSVAQGQAPNMGNIAQGFAAGAVGRAVGQDMGPVAGSLASAATNISIGRARK